MEVTREQLTRALEGIEVRVMDGDRSFRSVLECPADVAGDIIAELPGDGAGAELAATARIIGELEAIDVPALHGAARGPVWRALQHAAGRLGYVVCTED